MTRRRPNRAPRPLLGIALVGIALVGVASLGCNGSGETTGEPPPAGLPWLGQRFDLRTRVAAQLCGGSDAPRAITFATARLDQSGDDVTLTLSDETDDVVRDVVLHGCVVGDAATGFEVRVTGTSRSAVTQGQSTCAVRMAFPAALGEEIDRAEAAADLAGEAATTQGTSEDAWVEAGCPSEAEDPARAHSHVVWRVCPDGTLTARFDAQLAFTGYACHAGMPCVLGLEAEASVLAPHPDAPEDAILGGPCDGP